ncbi:MAG: MltA domain-containing protein [Paracoccaceae bacterium]
MLTCRDLPGWADDDLDLALQTYCRTADLLPPEWPRPGKDSAEAFFETQFSPCPAPQPALLTGYFEPVLAGSLKPEPPYHFPLYALPDGFGADGYRPSRAEITKGDLLRGSELVWLVDPLEAYLAQVQGSIRVRLPDGSLRRYGYAGKNGWPYHSIGAELVQRGAIAADGLTLAAIRDWAARHPADLPDLLLTNPSFVFFRQLDLDASSGPIGAMNRPVTAFRSLAVDPAYIPLGAPVWVEGGGFSSLMIAQDVGSAIKGAGRGDIFCGSGAEAGDQAGALRAKGRLVVFWPKGLAR